MSDGFHKMKRPFYPERSGFVAVSFLLCVLCAGVVFFLMPAVAAEEHSSGPLVLELSLEGVVDPILATYIDEGLADAAGRNSPLDTPMLRRRNFALLSLPIPTAQRRTVGSRKLTAARARWMMR